MNPIKLPRLNWFRYGLTYTGSLRTDPKRGCLSVTTFHYLVKMVDQRLPVICYFRLPIGSKTNMAEYEVGFFEYSDFGIEVAQNWIWSKAVDCNLPNYHLPGPSLVLENPVETDVCKSV